MVVKPQRHARPGRNKPMLRGQRIRLRLPVGIRMPHRDVVKKKRRIAGVIELHPTAVIKRRVDILIHVGHLHFIHPKRVGIRSHIVAIAKVVQLQFRSMPKLAKRRVAVYGSQTQIPRFLLQRKGSRNNAIFPRIRHIHRINDLPRLPIPAGRDLKQRRVVVRRLHTSVNIQIQNAPLGFVKRHFNPVKRALVQPAITTVPIRLRVAIQECAQILPLIRLREGATQLRL